MSSININNYFDISAAARSFRRLYDLIQLLKLCDAGDGIIAWFDASRYAVDYAIYGGLDVNGDK